jgi:hypothetical protein
MSRSVLLAMAAPAFALACLSSDPGPRLSHSPDLAPAPGEALPELEVLTSRLIRASSGQTSRVLPGPREGRGRPFLTLRVRRGSG